MKTRNKILAVVGALALSVSMLSACSGSSKPSREDKLNQSEQNFDERQPPNVTGDPEYNNYIRAQEEVYDDPSSVIWCSVFPQASNAPIFTVPVQGKLTSSTVSFYPGQSPEKWSWGSEGGYMKENQSVDGMYHGSPPPYRYGFTPAGQYVDFYNLPTFCTTALADFQKQSLVVEYQ